MCPDPRGPRRDLQIPPGSGHHPARLTRGGTCGAWRSPSSRSGDSGQPVIPATRLDRDSPTAPVHSDQATPTEMHTRAHQRVTYWSVRHTSQGNQPPVWGKNCCDLLTAPPPPPAVTSSLLRSALQAPTGQEGLLMALRSLQKVPPCFSPPASGHLLLWSLPYPVTACLDLPQLPCPSWGPTWNAPHQFFTYETLSRPSPEGFLIASLTRRPRPASPGLGDPHSASTPSSTDRPAAGHALPPLEMRQRGASSAPTEAVSTEPEGSAHREKALKLPVHLPLRQGLPSRPPSSQFQVLLWRSPGVPKKGPGISLLEREG